MNKLTDEQLDQIVDEALHSYPLATPPETLLADVMTRIETQEAIVPHFHLSWLDYAVSCTAAGGIGLLLFLWQFTSLSTVLFEGVAMFKLTQQSYIWLSLAGGLMSTALALLIASLLLPEGVVEFREV